MPYHSTLPGGEERRAGRRRKEEEGRGSPAPISCSLGRGGEWSLPVEERSLPAPMPANLPFTLHFAHACVPKLSQAPFCLTHRPLPGVGGFRLLPSYTLTLPTYCRHTFFCCSMAIPGGTGRTLEDACATQLPTWSLLHGTTPALCLCRHTCL